MKRLAWLAILALGAIAAHGQRVPWVQAAPAWMNASGSDLASSEPPWYIHSLGGGVCAIDAPIHSTDEIPPDCRTIMPSDLFPKPHAQFIRGPDGKIVLSGAVYEHDIDSTATVGMRPRLAWVNGEPVVMQPQTPSPCAIDSGMSVWLNAAAVQAQGVVSVYQNCVTYLRETQQAQWMTAPASGYQQLSGAKVPSGGASVMCNLAPSQRNPPPAKHHSKLWYKLHRQKPPILNTCQCGCAKLQSQCENDMGVCSSQ